MEREVSRVSSTERVKEKVVAGLEVWKRESSQVRQRRVNWKDSRRVRMYVRNSNVDVIFFRMDFHFMCLLELCFLGLGFKNYHDFRFLYRVLVLLLVFSVLSETLGII